MRSSPGQTIDWVALATGVSVDRILELLEEGVLVAVLPGADVPRSCTCEGSTHGRCDYCRMQLRNRLRDAAFDAARAPKAPVRGLRVHRE